MSTDPSPLSPPQGGYTSRVARYRPGSNKELQLLKNFQAWYAAHKGEYILATIDYQPVAQSVIVSQALRKDDDPAAQLLTLVSSRRRAAQLAAMHST